MTKKSDQRKTKAQLIEELQELRQQVAESQEAESSDGQERGTEPSPQLLLQALMDNLPEYIYFKDRESRFIRTSRAHAETFGLEDPAEVIGKTDFDFFTDEHARGAYEDEQSIVRTGEPILNIEERETWEDRPDTWVSTSKLPLRDQEGNIIGTFGISSDITARKRAEEALQRRAQQLRAAAEVAREATAILDVQDLLDRTVRLISERFRFYHAGIFLVDEPGEYAILRAASSEGGQRMLERGHRLGIGEEGIVGYVAGAGEPRIALDVGEDAVFFDNPDLPDTRSETALPLRARGQILGVLDVQSTQPAAFDEETVTILQLMADQVAVAIDNARLMARTESQLRELNLLYAEQSAAAWSALSSQRGQSYVYDRVDVHEADDVPSPALNEAQFQGKTVALAEPEGNRNVLAVPLKVRGQVIGALGIEESGDSGRWSSEEIALVETVADQIAVALDGARLFTEANIRAEEMTILNEVARSLTGSLSVEEVAEHTYRGVSRLLQTSNFCLGLSDAARAEIRFAFATSESEDERQGTSIPADEGLPGYVVQNRKDVLIKDNVPHRLQALGLDPSSTDAVSWLGAPILAGDQVLGMMAVESHTPNQTFDEHDRDLLAAIANQTAIALQNVRLFSQTQRRVQQERQTYEITSQLRRSPDISTILQTAVSELGRALQTDRAMVRLMVKPTGKQDDRARGDGEGGETESLMGE